MQSLKFTKMHGLGNDFMVVDGINQKVNPQEMPLQKWSNRHTGIGFDQFLLVESAQNKEIDFVYRIFNADGTEVEQCGNGARCFARFVVEKKLTNKHEMVVQTARGVIVLKLEENEQVRVNMGQPQFDLKSIPFVSIDNKTAETTQHAIKLEQQTILASVVSMGNPHTVLLVDCVETASVETLGTEIESHPQFPQRVNVGFMQVISPEHIKLRVFERGVGETNACGSGACAAVVSGIRLGLLKENQPIRVSLTGGDLFISWALGKDVMMIGPATTVFEGEVAY